MRAFVDGWKEDLGVESTTGELGLLVYSYDPPNVTSIESPGFEYPAGPSGGWLSPQAGLVRVYGTNFGSRASDIEAFVALNSSSSCVVAGGTSAAVVPWGLASNDDIIKLQGSQKGGRSAGPVDLFPALIFCFLLCSFVLLFFGYSLVVNPAVRFLALVLSHCTTRSACMSDGAQTPCKQGTASPKGARACADCQPGTFTATSGQSSCGDCLEGRSQDSYKKTNCEPCSGGYFADKKGAASCTKCDAGQFSVAESKECTPCPSGQCVVAPQYL